MPVTVAYNCVICWVLIKAICVSSYWGSKIWWCHQSSPYLGFWWTDASGLSVWLYAYGQPSTSSLVIWCILHIKMAIAGEGQEHTE